MPCVSMEKKRIKTYNEARLHLKKAEATSNLDSDDDVIKRKRKMKRVYSPEDSDSGEDGRSQCCAIAKMKKTHSSVTYPTILLIYKRLLTATRNRVEMVYNNEENLTPGCIHGKHLAIQQSHLIQVVTDLSVQMNEVNRKLDLLLAWSSLHPTNQQEDRFTIPDFLTNLPVKDDISFCNLNNQLKIGHNKQCMMKFLAGIGGRNPRSLTTNILRRVLLDEVAELYSLTGKQMKNSSKKSFLTTETCKIIFQICKQIFDDATDDQLKEVTSDWLNQSKVRLRRRADKQNNQASESDVSGCNVVIL
uniref:Uncharacterized protein LOC114346490 n=1 Tax=Diabrotica virgifera virgifera TaxID=50390 RepID=A0A6P7HB09_DIAVI